MKATWLAVVMGAALSAGSAMAACGGGGCGGGACGTGTTPAASSTTAEGKSVDTATLAKWVQDGGALTVLDARAAKWDDGKRIPGAKALSTESKAEDIAAALPDKNAKIVTYCAGGTCNASAKLAEKLRGLGYANVIEYPEGIAGWTKAGQKVDEAKK